MDRGGAATTGNEVAVVAVDVGVAGDDSGVLDALVQGLWFCAFGLHDCDYQRGDWARTMSLWAKSGAGQRGPTIHQAGEKIDDNFAGRNWGKMFKMARKYFASFSLSFPPPSICNSFLLSLNSFKRNSQT